MNMRENKGITIVTLVITIILLIIISGISITGVITNKKEVEASKQVTELKIIQHAILQKYTASLLTKEILPGDLIDNEQLNEIVNEINSKTGENIILKGTEYKELNTEDLKKLGIIDQEDVYIVNYMTGEVINKTQKVTKTGVALYIYSKNE